jgi:D-tyrosyl-tRNA(Tyr) deacylase
MRVVIQRVTQAFVTISGTSVGKIEKGLFLLVGFEAADTEEDIAWMTKKIVHLRIFDDADGVMNLSIEETPHTGILVVSQFTLHAGTKKGNRPSYIRAAAPDLAIPLYESFLKELKTLFHGPVETGRFGAEMQVTLTNDGPVTIWIDTKNKE